MRKIAVSVEVKTDSLGTRVYGDTSHLGPEKTRFTWRAYANILFLHAGFAIPFNRVENLVGGKPFTRSMMVRCVKRFAEAFLPIYQYIGKSVLPNATLLSVDDAHTRTNETTRVLSALRGRKESLETALMKGTLTQETAKEQAWFELPWKPKEKLVGALHADFALYPPLCPGSFERKGEIYRINALKSTLKLQTTVITCTDDSQLSAEEKKDTALISYEKRGRLVFYRTDFQSAGLLLGEILTHRSKALLQTPLVIQGDMSPENHVVFPQNPTNPSLQPEHPLTLRYAGCMAHARRPFVRYFKEDEFLCESMLDVLQSIANHEQIVGHVPVTPAELIKIRQESEEPLWRGAMSLCWGFLDYWSSSTPLGRAIRYVLRHSDALTLYLNDANLDATNNICENLVRFEALNDASSFGCAT